MVQTIAATDITLGYLKTKFGLQLARDDQFFTEWLEELPEITTNEQQFLNEVKEEYFHLVERRSLLKDLVKMVVLSPLLKVAGFYRPTFEIETEAQVQLAAEDEGKIG